MTQNQQAICARALSHYGYPAQHKKLIEECAELIVCTTHLADGKCTVQNWANEVADVIIMCEQMRLSHAGIIGDAIRSKLARLTDMIDNA